MTCLICRYFQPTEPAQHKADREAGACQSNCGDKWNWYTARNYVKNHGDLKGWCRAHPKPELVGFNHFCGDISVYEYLLNSRWGVERFDKDDNLFEWAQKQLTTVLHGTWEHRHNERIANENEQLKQQLKRARKISASRLARLQKNKQEQKPEPKPETEPEAIPTHLRLVAAE